MKWLKISLLVLVFHCTSSPTMHQQESGLFNKFRLSLVFIVCKQPHINLRQMASLKGSTGQSKQRLRGSKWLSTHLLYCLVWDQFSIHRYNWQRCYWCIQSTSQTSALFNLSWILQSQCEKWIFELSVKAIFLLSKSNFRSNNLHQSTNVWIRIENGKKWST